MLKILYIISSFPQTLRGLVEPPEHERPPVGHLHVRPPVLPVLQGPERGAPGSGGTIAVVVGVALLGVLERDGIVSQFSLLFGPHRSPHPPACHRPPPRVREGDHVVSLEGEVGGAEAILRRGHGHHAGLIK